MIKPEIMMRQFPNYYGVIAEFDDDCLMATIPSNQLDYAEFAYEFAQIISEITAKNGSEIAVGFYGDAVTAVYTVKDMDGQKTISTSFETRQIAEEYCKFLNDMIERIQKTA